jgi:hypothetical protein
MAMAANSGGHPQNAALTAAGVSLARPELMFLSALVHIVNPQLPALKELPELPAPEEPQEVEYDPFGLPLPTPIKPAKASKPDLLSLGKEAGLRPIDVAYIREWVVDQGVHWLTCENVGLDDDIEGRRVFRNPVVRRVINAAQAIGLCNGTTASKEELADWYTQRIRSPHLPEQVKDNAADKLAKLMGYYPDSTGKGNGSTNVQINFVNPYTTAPVVDAEVVENA